MKSVIGLHFSHCLARMWNSCWLGGGNVDNDYLSAVAR